MKAAIRERYGPPGEVVTLRDRCHQQIGVAEPVANIPDRDLRPDAGCHVEDGSKLCVLCHGERDHLVRVVVHHGPHVGTPAIDRAMDRALGVLRAAAQIDGIAVEIVFDDVVQRHQFRAARAGQEEPVGPFRMAHADMAVGVHHALMGKNAVRGHQIPEQVGGTHATLPS